MHYTTDYIPLPREEKLVDAGDGGTAQVTLVCAHVGAQIAQRMAARNHDSVDGSSAADRALKFVFLFLPLFLRLVVRFAHGPRCFLALKCRTNPTATHTTHAS